MAARQFRVLAAQVLRPARGFVMDPNPVVATLTEPTVVLSVVSCHLKAKPVDYAVLTDAQALDLAASLVLAVRRRQDQG